VKSSPYPIDAYKLVAGQQVFMGAIDVMLNAAATELAGSVGRLHLVLNGSYLSARLTVADQTLFRLIEATKH